MHSSVQFFRLRGGGGSSGAASSTPAAFSAVICIRVHGDRQQCQRACDKRGGAGARAFSGSQMMSSSDHREWSSSAADDASSMGKQLQSTFRESRTHKRAGGSVFFFVGAFFFVGRPDSRQNALALGGR